MNFDITEFFPLAQRIAQSFSNIPGLDSREIEMQAQEALAAAARQYEPTKGDFNNYAARAVRNALCSLYEKQHRHHQYHAYVMHQAASSSTQADFIHSIPDADQDSVATQVSREQSIDALRRAIAHLPDRQKLVINAISTGKSYSEIGNELDISKQAVHKIATSAIQALRKYLEAEGFGGLDSVGLLKSFRKDFPNFG